MTTEPNIDPDYLKWQERMSKFQKPDQNQVQKSKEEVAYLINCYKKVFSGEEGQTVLADLERQFKYKESVYMESSRMTDFFLGQQSSVIFIHHIINLKES